METPVYGKRLLPCVLDELATKDPRKLFAAIPKAADLSEGFVDISVADVARCVDFMSAKIKDRFGSSECFETLAYTGIPDLRGVVVFYAAVKCGYKLLLLSPRNPASTNSVLMGRTTCSKLLYPTEASPIIKPLVDLEPSFDYYAIPSFADMVNSTPEKYIYHKKFDEAINDPLLVLHSSGSTGLPKPITMTNGSFAVLDYERTLPATAGRKKMDHSIWNFEGEARVYSVFPFFHLGGFLGQALIPNGDLLKDILRQQKVRALALVPAVAEQLLNEPNGDAFFRDLDYLCHGGAPMNPTVGDRLSKLTRLISPFGSTEIFSQPELVVSSEDWQWHEFNPYMKHEMQLYDEDVGTFELVIFADESNKDRAGLYHNLPGTTEYRTKDLFTRHPTKPQLYKYYGRKDDIIVLANGEKFNPLPLEMKIQGHPLLKGAVVVGSRRTQTALLVEPKEPLDEEGRARLIKQLWPFVEESNAVASGQGRIHPGQIICAVQEKPFARTSKGTVVRKLSEEIYKDEIEELYSSQQNRVQIVELGEASKYDLPAVVRFVRAVFATSFPAASTIDENEDFFTHGLDSIQTVAIVTSLKRSLQKHSESLSWVSPKVIFYNSNIADMSNLVKNFLNEGTVPGTVSEASQTHDMDETLGRFVEALPKTQPRGDKLPNTSTVAIIGSTGFLGSQLVATLLKKPGISRIYCLNRSTDAQRRQETALLEIDEGLRSKLTHLEYMTTEIGKPSLGLSQDKYDVLLREVGVIVYNSWRLDFGLGLRSFEPFLQTTVELVKLSSLGHHNMHIVFVGSLATVGNLGKTKPAPEAPIKVSSAAINVGYAQSKLVAERILAAASQQCGVPISVLRVGQIGGVANGRGQKWADQPWVSSIIRTALALRCAPSHVALVDWIPVDTIATILGDCILRPMNGAGIGFFHPSISYAESPRWELLLSVLEDVYGVKESVPLPEWVGRLRSIPYPNADDLARLPALKLLDYFEAFGEGMETADFETGRSSSFSQVRISPVTKEMLVRWLGDWDLKDSGKGTS
ncbi:hypothetical protein ABKA04_008087 [Annulohypoxylon sp. FPYF3050]